MANAPVTVVRTQAFNRQIEKLEKKHHSVDDDVETLIIQLEQGATPGTRIPGVGNRAYKYRIKITSSGLGSRDGGRVIYYVRTKTCVYLLAVYIKAELKNLPNDVIKNIVRGLDDTLKGKEGC